MIKNYFFAAALLITSAAHGNEKPALPNTTGLPPGVLTPSKEAVLLVDEGDAFFKLRTEEKGAVEAIAAYEKALQKDPMLTEAFWKASRAAHWAGDRNISRKEKMVWFEKGIEYAQQALKLDAKSVESHFWLGANFGSYGETKGVLKSLSLVKPIRKEMESVIQLDDHYQGGAGYRVLGVVDYKVPGFAGGNKKRALENLLKAQTVDASNPFNQYYLAEYYDTVGDRYKALDHLTILDGLIPTRDADTADLKSIQGKGKKLRKRLEK